MLIVLKSGNLTLLELSGPLQASTGIALPLPFTCWHIVSDYTTTAALHISSDYLLITLSFDTLHMVRVTGRIVKIKTSFAYLMWLAALVFARFSTETL